MTVNQLFTDEVNKLIADHNAYDKINTFIYKNPDCAPYLPERFANYVAKSNQIEHELIPFACTLHGRKVRVHPDKFQPHGEKLIEGVIEHVPTRWYTDGYTNQQRETHNTVPFRRTFEDETYSAPETIALWVNTGDKRSTHLYTANNIQIID